MGQSHRQLSVEEIETPETPVGQSRMDRGKALGAVGGRQNVRSWTARARSKEGLVLHTWAAVPSETRPRRLCLTRETDGAFLCLFT